MSWHKKINKLKKQGFTLIELLVAITLFAIFIVGLYHAFSVGILAYFKGEESFSSYQNARLVLNRFANDFQNAFYSSDLGLKGEKDEIQFYLINEDQLDLDTFQKVKVRYTLKKEGDSYSLVREEWDENQSDKEKSKPTISQEIAYPIQKVRFSYFQEDQPSNVMSASVFSKEEEKKFKWDNKWDEKAGIPLGVRIQLTYEEKTFSRWIISPRHYLYALSGSSPVFIQPGVQNAPSR